MHESPRVSVPHLCGKCPHGILPSATCMGGESNLTSDSILCDIICEIPSTYYAECVEDKIACLEKEAPMCLLPSQLLHQFSLHPLCCKSISDIVSEQAFCTPSFRYLS